MVRSDLIKLI